MGDALYAEGGQSALCPQLYRKLQELTNGPVSISNEGEAMLTNNCYNPATGRHETWITHSGEYYRIHCPFCKDSRPRLWVNHMYGQQDVNGRPMRFLATCYNENCLADPDNWLAFNDSLFGFRNAADRRNYQPFQVQRGRWEDPNLHTVHPPGELEPVSRLPAHHRAVQYMLEERRYTRDMLDRYKISYCRRADQRFRAAQDRIVFPIYMHDELVGWQCRYMGTADWKRVPKYYGMPGMKKKAMLYNFDLAKTYPFVVVVEGPTDANAVGDAGVALLGKSLSHTQKQLLVATWDRKPIIFMLDPDAREESWGTIQDLMNLNTNPIVAVDLPPGNDPSDYGYETVWNIIRSTCHARGVILG